MKKNEKIRCEALAKEGFGVIESIMLKRDDTVRTVRTKLVWMGRGGKYLRGEIIFKTDGEPFSKLEADIICSNLIEFGGFDDIKIMGSEDLRTISVSANIGGKPVEKKTKKYQHQELTLSDLIEFVKAHPEEFPAGLNSKVSLGDYECNTYCRKISLGSDNGRLYISHALHGDTDPSAE